jgi:hypothetical protein
MLEAHPTDDVPLCGFFTSGPENWIVYKAWWGNRSAMAKGDLSGIAGVNSFNSVHPVRLRLIVVSWWRITKRSVINLFLYTQF